MNLKEAKKEFHERHPKCTDEEEIAFIEGWCARGISPKTISCRNII